MSGFSISPKEQKQIEFLFNKMIPTAFKSYLAKPEDYLTLHEYTEKVDGLLQLIKDAQPALERYQAIVKQSLKQQTPMVANSLERCLLGDFNLEETSEEAPTTESDD